MGKVRLLIITVTVFASAVCHATILHYSLGGTMRYADTSFNNIHTAGIFGDMYISDVPSVEGPIGIQSDYWDIVSFAINAGEHGWGGAGTIWTPLYGSLETQIHIDSPGGTDWVTGSASFYNVGFTDPDQLPDEMNWPGFGWYFGDQYFAQILSLNMTRVPTSVPEPPAMLLLGIALVGLFSIARRERAS